MLGYLGLSGVRKRKKTAIDLSRPEKPESEKGLNPLDLLSLPAAQRDLVNFLSRRKQATLAAIQERMKTDDAELMANIKALKDIGYIHEALMDDEIHYRVVFGGKVSRSGRGVPQNIWDAVDLDNTVFLKQVDLFSQLSDDERQQIAFEMDAKRYKRNEVILWQGDVSDSIYFIKTGIVGISRLTPESNSSEIEVLAYLKQGDILGEHNLFTEHQYAAMTTATALSEVELLVLSKEHFLSLMLNYDKTALKLAKMLAQRLLSVNTRLSSKGADVRLSLVFGIGKMNPRTLGISLAMTLGESTRRKAVYTEHPNPDNLRELFKMDKRQEVIETQSDYDIACIKGSPGLPAAVRTTLVMDHLLNDYANVVIGLPGKIDEAMTYMLEKANQIIILSEPNQSEQVSALNTALKAYIHPERTNIFTVIQKPVAVENTSNSDYTIQPYTETFNYLEWQISDIPADIATVTHNLADRLGRTNQIGVYIPSTTDVDQVVDTSEYIDRTIAFLGKIFNGVKATSNAAHGVWNSDEVGLVSEAIYIVRTYVTQAELDRYLGDVLEYVEVMKEELSQEAMAVEVNQKLMLI